jgi:hypothetical protein
MPSQALQEWRTTQRAELDRLDAAVRASERALRQQLVDAYILLLAGQFQLYCRGLHDDAVEFAADHVRPSGAVPIVNELLFGRMLDRGNAHSAALAADFRWLGSDVWTELFRSDPRNRGRKVRLDQLNVWRNAVAHQALPLSAGNAATTAGTARTLRWARVWRSNCSALAHQLDMVVKNRLTAMLGIRPW